MPTLLPDLVRAFRDANLEAAGSVDREVERAERLRKRAEDLRELLTEHDTLLRRVVRAARAGTRDNSAASEEVEELWAATVRSLRGGLTADEQVAALRACVEAAEAGREHLASVRRLWAEVERVGGNPEEAKELAIVACRFDRVHSEATRSLEARLTSWHPADPARFEQGREEVREGKAIGPDEARSRFRKPDGRG